MPYHLDLLRQRARSDPNIIGLVLSGSAAREGMTTEHSDVDVFVLLEDPTGWQTTRSREIDTVAYSTTT
jgi:tRNA nucleotidyltransferase (CCA-adding enzyme)